MAKQIEPRYSNRVLRHRACGATRRTLHLRQAPEVSAGRRAAAGIAILAAAVWLFSGGVAWSGQERLLWENQFDAGDFDFAAQDAVAVEGNRVFVAGGATGATVSDIDFFVRAFDARHGTPLWEDRFDLAAGDDSALGITTGEGLVFASGSTTTDAGILVPLIRAYDARTGALLWQDVGANQGLFDSATVHDGWVFAIGVIGEDPVPTPGVGFFFRSDWLVRAYHAKTGDLLWEDRFGAPDPVGTIQFDRPVTVAGGSGQVFVGGRGHAAAGEPRSWFVRALDARGGQFLWQDQVFPVAVSAQVQSIVVTGDRLIAVGRHFTRQSPLNEDWLIRALNTKTGQLLWQDVVDKGVSQLEAASDVAVSEGRVFAVGIAGATCRFNVSSPNNCDGLIRTYDLQSGQFLWEDRLNEAPADQFISVAAQGDRVFAVGLGDNDCAFSGLPTNCDMIVRAYNAETGMLTWEDRVDKTGNDDIGQGIAVLGGRVFAAGNVFDAYFRPDLLVRTYVARDDD